LLVRFPVRLDTAVFAATGGWPALISNSRNIGDFRRWKDQDQFKNGFGRLLRDLKATPPTEAK
jgi:hypothetical protein